MDKVIDYYTIEVNLYKTLPYYDKLASMQMFSPQKERNLAIL